jgi:uncharacterized DUF497 family protein
MAFEWDDAKNGQNFAKHGIRFEEAIAIFDGPVLTATDPRAYGELREISFGWLGSLVGLAVVHTDRSGVRRIISARCASVKERRLFYDHLERAAGTD